MWIDLPESHFRQHKKLSKLYKFKQAGDRKNYHAKCESCSKIIKWYKPEILVEHSLLECDDKDGEINQELKEDVRLIEATRKPTQTIDEKTAAGDFTDQMNNMLVDVIATDCLPISTVESKQFRLFIRKTNPSYVVPSRRKFTNVLLPKRAEVCKENIMKLIRDSPRYSLTLEFDGWTSRAETKFIAMSLTTINGRSLLVDLIDVSSARQVTGEYLKDQALVCLEKLGLDEKKLNAIVTDEDSAYKKSRRMIVEGLTERHVLQYRCTAHVLNLVGSHMSADDSIKCTLKKLVDLILIITRHSKLMSKLKELGANRPSLIVPTRWYSTSSAINSIIQLKTELELVPREDIYSAPLWVPILEDRSFWLDLHDLKVYFDYLSRAIGVAETSFATISQGFRAILEFGRLIEKQIRFKEAAIIALRTHFSRMDLKILLAAYMLDPRQSYLYLTKDARKMGLAGILGILLGMRRYTEEAKKDLKHSVYEEAARFKTKLKQLRNADINNIYEWWNGQTDFTYLRQVGKRLASCHPSSANTERIFSGLGRIVTKDRTRLHTQTIFELMAVRMYNTPKVNVKKKLEALIANDDETNSTISSLDEDLQPRMLSSTDASQEGGVASTEFPLLEDIFDDIYDQLSDVHERFESFKNTEEYQLFSRLIDFDEHLEIEISETSENARDTNRAFDDSFIDAEGLLASESMDDDEL